MDFLVQDNVEIISTKRASQLAYEVHGLLIYALAFGEKEGELVQLNWTGDDGKYRSWSIRHDNGEIRCQDPSCMMYRPLPRVTVEDSAFAEFLMWLAAACADGVNVTLLIRK